MDRIKETILIIFCGTGYFTVTFQSVKFSPVGGVVSQEGQQSPGLITSFSPKLSQIGSTHAIFWHSSRSLLGVVVDSGAGLKFCTGHVGQQSPGLVSGIPSMHKGGRQTMSLHFPCSDPGCVVGSTHEGQQLPGLVAAAIPSAHVGMSHIMSAHFSSPGTEIGSKNNHLFIICLDLLHEWCLYSIVPRVMETGGEIKITTFHKYDIIINCHYTNNI
jgi:hypothetical protein